MIRTRGSISAAAPVGAKRGPPDHNTLSRKLVKIVTNFENSGFEFLSKKRVPSVPQLKMLDTYEVQRVLFIDEVKIDSFKYGDLLQLLQGYRTSIHARYNNVYSLWRKIHITLK